MVLAGAGMTLEERYKLACETPSDIYLHLPRFVQMVHDLDAKHVIELGVRSGVSTIAWLYGLTDTEGRLTSVDLDPAPPIGHFYNWQFIQGDDLDPAVLKQLEPADIVFIDTSHAYVQTVNELHTYRHLVRPGGLLVLHDTELMWPEGVRRTTAFPVKRAIEAFCHAEGLNWKNISECWGLGIIRL